MENKLVASLIVPRGNILVDDEERDREANDSTLFDAIHAVQ